MTPAEVLDEWFGPLDKDGLASPEKRERWFKKDPAFDQSLKQRYRQAIDQAAAGELGWDDSTEARLAEIILLDQMSRNVYRGSGQMYQGDARALELVGALLESGDDTRLPTAHRIFAYMPLMHSEQLADQDRCVECFEKQLASCAESAKQGLSDNLKYAKMHRNIVARFDRFPHRNELLGRETTEEEAEFLTLPGSSF